MGKRKQVRFTEKKNQNNNWRKPEDESINRDLFKFKGLTITHRVSLAKKMYDGTYRTRFYEQTYTSNKYTDQKELVTYGGEQEDYIIFNFRKESGETTQILASYSHISRIRSLFINASRWYTSNKFIDVFIEDKEQGLVVNEEREVYELASGLVKGNALRIEPHVITFQEDDGQITIVEGAVLFYNSEENYVFLTSDDVMAVADFFTTFDMYTSSLALMNTLKFVK